MTLVRTLLGEQALAVWIVLGVVGFALTWKGANVVEDTTEKLSDHYGISQAIQGSLIVAVATSFPELAIIVISVLLLGEFGVGAGALIGTAVFNILVIPGAVALTAGTTTTTRGIVYRDALFYIVAILGFFAVIALGILSTDGPEVATVSPAMGVGLLCLYAVYVVLIVEGRRNSDTDVTRAETAVGKQVGRFLGGLGIILVGVESMVTMTVEIAAALGAPPFLISVTVLSVLSSFPDLLVGVKMGQGGDRKAAMANVFGTNTFNLVGAFPIGIILAGGISVSFLTSVPLLLFLFYSTLVVIVAAATDFELTRREGAVLLGLYVLFLLWMVSEATGSTAYLTEGTLETILG